jgi:alanyl-tRNA synthetase
MSFVEAKKIGADGIFEDKYAQVDKLSVYIIDDGNISKEICSGPHVKSLKAFNGLIFKIVKQKSVGSGVRRVRCELIKE